jgi:hypothetical protein
VKLLASVPVPAPLDAVSLAALFVVSLLTLLVTTELVESVAVTPRL